MRRIEEAGDVSASDERDLSDDEPGERRGSDPLTGLLDRSEIERSLGGLDEADAIERRVGVVFLDLDRFKPVNDKFGHAAGDAVLRIVAERLSGAVRPGDVLARFGGDEFVVVCEGADSDALEALARRLVVAVADPIKIGDTVVEVGASAGVARAGEVAGPITLLEQADLAMYLAKSERVGVVHFDGAVAQRLLTRTAERTDVEDAMRRGEIRVQLRPVVAASTRRPIALESRLVWADGDGVGAGQDLRARAKDLGILHDLVRHEVIEACSAVEQLSALQPGADRLRVLISIDGDDVTDRAMAGALHDAVAAGRGRWRLGLIVRGPGRWDDGTALRILRDLAAMGVALTCADLTTRDLLSAVDSWAARSVLLDDDLVVAAVAQMREREVLRAEVSLAKAIGLQVAARCPDDDAADLAERLGVDEIAGAAAGPWCASDELAAMFERLWTASLISGPALDAT